MAKAKSTARSMRERVKQTTKRPGKLTVGVVGDVRGKHTYSFLAAQARPREASTAKPDSLPSSSAIRAFWAAVRSHLRKVGFTEDQASESVRAFTERLVAAGAMSLVYHSDPEYIAEDLAALERTTKAK